MKSRSSLAIAAGIISALFAGVLLSLSAFLALTESTAGSPLSFALMSVFPMLVALACLGQKWRTVALRMVGGVTALVVGWILIQSYINPEIKVGRTGRGLYVAMCVGAISIAAKGRWPSSNPQADPDSVGAESGT
ncbi:hypothetical protein [Stieleria varia]|uniref:Uncharacterized protein n=1 Tax=Stieleria varia TaxID=2528005 RepID=A0A5C6B095_9BACT|nr:hypothetical protein [Stieleria varia]TWU05715.1 hypothetical protein Pla52n_14300 [Stieleria varia]